MPISSICRSNLGQNSGEEKRRCNSLGITRGPFEREGEGGGVFEFIYLLVKVFEL